jgi:hypothetical protein
VLLTSFIALLIVALLVNTPLLLTKMRERRVRRGQRQRERRAAISDAKEAGVIRDQIVHLRNYAAYVQLGPDEMPIITDPHVLTPRSDVPQREPESAPTDLQATPIEPDHKGTLETQLRHLENRLESLRILRQLAAKQKDYAEEQRYLAEMNAIHQQIAAIRQQIVKI